MPLSAAKIRRSKRQNEKSFVVYYNIGFCGIIYSKVFMGDGVL